MALLQMWVSLLETLFLHPYPQHRGPKSAIAAQEFLRSRLPAGSGKAAGEMPGVSFGSAQSRIEITLRPLPRLHFLKLRYGSFPDVFVTRSVSEGAVECGFSLAYASGYQNAQLQKA
jgi:hypothetical protein